ncbi:ComF family protein [Viridibacterium curvum]|uniref:ComF family protein n=1 Tax=Viridibacterium curvum TaxID=1101404 RepID=A0ABP9QC10_9RHOO
MLCAACDGDLPQVGAACPVCANPSPGGQRCGSCLKRVPQFDASRALFEYRHPVREMVLALKHGQGFALANWFCEKALPLDDLQPDLVVAMPLHPRRLAERGFNPIMLVARELSRRKGWRLDMQGVVRDSDTPHQAGQGLKQRLRNVRGAFRCTTRLDGMHVLLMDDVMTSGATLNELARTVKIAGAAKVTNLVLARAVMSMHGR